jgi:acid phosphatase (class A)
MLRRPLLAFVLLVAATVLAAAADTKYGDFIFVKPGQVDLGRVLAPAPLADSQRQKDDLAAVLDAQKMRTPAQVEQAVGDNALSVYRFADVLGEDFAAGRLPQLDAFLKRAYNDSRILVLSSKDVWNRPRPYAASPLVQTVGERPRSPGSYPSGHAIFGALTAILLANMVPEKSVALFARGEQYGVNRVIAGVHFPSDIEAGRIAGAVIASALMQNPQFRIEFAAAAAELRALLGLPGLPETKPNRLQTKN